MADKRINIRVSCEGIRRTLVNRTVELSVNESRALYFGGVNIRRDYCIEPPGEEYRPTGVYSIQIHRVTPEIVNNERISSHAIQLVEQNDHMYRFAVSLTTAAMPDLKLATKNELRKKKLLTSPNGIDGYIDATISGSFYGWVPQTESRTANLHAITLDTGNDDFQLVRDYAYLGEGFEQTRFSCDIPSRLPDSEKVFCKWIGSVLYVKYSETRIPEISQYLPESGAYVCENFRPQIGAAFNDFNGSGIDISTFVMTIDRQSISDQVNVLPGTGGLELTADGFRYVPSTDLSVGVHQVEVQVDDLHGNRATAQWSFFIEYDTPAIVNMSPAPGTTVDSPRPTFSAQFDDRGEQGIDADSFELILDGREPVTKGARGLLLNANGFSYRPPFNLKPGSHSYRVVIADNAEQRGEIGGEFALEMLPINSFLGSRPIADLQGVGRTTQTRFEQRSGGAITCIQDLLNQDPQSLSVEIGLSMSQMLEHITRANILCTQASFNRMSFGELWSQKIWDIAHMTDQEIIDFDTVVDAEGHEVVEPQGDIDELRANIALLFICLDDAVLQDITFGDIVNGQPELTYYQ